MLPATLSLCRPQPLRVGARLSAQPSLSSSTGKPLLPSVDSRGNKRKDANGDVSGDEPGEGDGNLRGDEDGGDEDGGDEDGGVRSDSEEERNDEQDMHVMRQLLEDFRDKRLFADDRQAMMTVAGGQFTELLEQHWNENSTSPKLSGSGPSSGRSPLPPLHKSLSSTLLQHVAGVELRKMKTTEDSPLRVCFFADRACPLKQVHPQTRAT